MDSAEYLAILKIFADQNPNADPPSGGPQHCIPKLEATLAGSRHGVVEIGRYARLDRKYRLPAFDKGRGRIRDDAGLSRYDTEEFSQRLQRLNTGSMANRSLYQIGGSLVPDVLSTA